MNENLIESLAKKTTPYSEGRSSAKNPWNAVSRYPFESKEWFQWYRGFKDGMRG